MALAAALLVGAGPTSGQITPLDATCPANYTCIWKVPLYTGNKILLGAGEAPGWHNFDNSKYSAKNRFSNRCVILSWTYNGNGPYWTLNPGEENNNATGGGWESYNVLPAGTLCA